MAAGRQLGLRVDGMSRLLSAAGSTQTGTVQYPLKNRSVVVRHVRMPATPSVMRARRTRRASRSVAPRTHHAQTIESISYYDVGTRVGPDTFTQLSESYADYINYTICGHAIFVANLSTTARQK